MRHTQLIKAFFLVGIIFLLGNNIINAQDINASTIKIGPFYLEMKMNEVEKIIGEKIQKKKNAKDDYAAYQDLKIVHQGIVYTMSFYEDYNLDEKAPKKYILASVKSEDSRIKTKSGIAIGMSKAAIMQILGEQNIEYSYSKWFDYDENGKVTTKLRENLSINDTKASRSLILTMEKGKVVGFELGYGGEEGGC
jgi:hypothetical protein